MIKVKPQANVIVLSQMKSFSIIDYIMTFECKTKQNFDDFSSCPPNNRERPGQPAQQLQHLHVGPALLHLQSAVPPAQLWAPHSSRACRWAHAPWPVPSTRTWHAGPTWCWWTNANGPTAFIWWGHASGSAFGTTRSIPTRHTEFGSNTQQWRGKYPSFAFCTLNKCRLFLAGLFQTVHFFKVLLTLLH